MHKARIATIGFFDGVHRGHRFLFAQLKELAHEHDLEPLILTFNRHPRELLTGVSPSLLTTSMERQQLLTLHAEVRFLDFSDVQGLTAEQFMQYLYYEEDVQVLLMGYDHRFGSDGIKGFSEYVKIAKRVGMRVERAHECVVDSLPVSSTRIRKLLNVGKIEEVNRLLGYKYSLSGLVEHGNGIGNQIGFPTANIAFETNKQLPMAGVYSAHALIDNQEFSAIVNIGNNPTIGNSRITVETHVLNFEGNLYGRLLTVQFQRFLRPEQQFSSLEELQLQIKKDIHSLT